MSQMKLEESKATIKMKISIRKLADACVMRDFKTIGKMCGRTPRNNNEAAIIIDAFLNKLRIAESLEQ